MRAVMATNCFKYVPTWLNPSVQGVLLYSNIDSSTMPGSSSQNWADAIQPSQCVDLAPSLLVPTVIQWAPASTVRYDISVSFSFAGTAGTQNRGFMNQKTWSPLVGTTSLQLSQLNVSTLSTNGLVQTVSNVTVADLVINNFDVGKWVAF